ncbi:UDP-N-acetylglucosamine 1-carboxyvinyltransferase [Pseudenhygromyxa sp. WMMC2535]|uniref:UDP-N-acetylglucosamine 1-carboxyvinyltransferase n=1 Tax=Pseudenhygromyxa sp. WMMC2535 TaxID=2712867 RepID=UPI0015576BB8|nr:UDP-N-acetylglucosamine 1-carboxyvinyltransferase [Pseudenhygromyxa sp. WMMC2535]NVB39282.1 UDP-N-acetylglucosamine 1-carboxyvinyltransferase [Pseudenhygromyxa sp. WMMC2535]
MDKIEISGKHPGPPGTGLCGKLTIRGAKNAALPIQCAALLGQGTTRLRHLPRLTDVSTMNGLLRELGCSVAADMDARTVEIDPDQVGAGTLEAPYEQVKTMRASVTVMGPLLGRFGRARVSLPGGCAIGARPIDQHLKGLEALGAEVELAHGYVELRAKRLIGARFSFDKVTVGGTQNVMMAASLAKGHSLLENVAREPEVQELAVFLNKMGARISGAGTDAIEIEGVDALNGIDHAILPDRIEAGTFAIAAAITRGDVLLEHAPVDHMHAVIDKLVEAGVECRVEDGGLRVIGPERIRPIDVVTRPHPGFPTDMQAQIMVLAAMADGASVIRETIFENRFMHVPELNRLGADIVVNGNTAVIRGPTRFSGTTVMATDLRASASLVLAGLVADGQTEVRRVYHLDRGYEAIEARLRPLGAEITRYHGAGA